MKLNDPFGRVSRRHSQAYAAFCRQLQERGLRDAEALAGLATAMTRSVLSWAAVTLTSGALAVVLFPDLRAVVAVCVALVLLWLVSGWWQARLHLRRFRIEACSNNVPNPEGGDP